MKTAEEVQFLATNEEEATNSALKVPKCEIFHLFDFNDFYGIKSL